MSRPKGIEIWRRNTIKIRALRGRRRKKEEEEEEEEEEEGKERKRKREKMEGKGVVPLRLLSLFLSSPCVWLYTLASFSLLSLALSLFLPASHPPFLFLSSRKRKTTQLSRSFPCPLCPSCPFLCPPACPPPCPLVFYAISERLGNCSGEAGIRVAWVAWR